MLQRYVALRSFIDKVLHEDVVDHLLHANKESTVDDICKLLKKLVSNIEKLQDTTISISEAQNNFDSVRKRLPSTNNRLKPNSEIVVNLKSELALIKI